jgi:outer membrane protein assembly factor BamA
LTLIDRVTFKGLPQAITERDVRAYLSAHKIRLSEGESYHPTKLQWAQNYFNEFLIARGLWRVSATGTARKTAPAHVSVEFSIAPNE